MAKAILRWRPVTIVKRRRNFGLIAVFCSKHDAGDDRDRLKCLYDFRMIVTGRGVRHKATVGSHSLFCKTNFFLRKTE